MASSVLSSPELPKRLRMGDRASRAWIATCFLALHSCGPSFEAIQEGDLRFAHCDRLDLDPNIAPSHRLHCWREWRRVYTYGQTRDRVEYAQRRIAEVVSGDTEPPFALPSGAPAPAETRKRVPEAAVEAPPPVLAEPAAAAVPEPVDAMTACRQRCNAEHFACLPGCETQPTGCKPCEPSLESCLSLCGSAQ